MNETIPADTPGALPCNSDGIRTTHTCELCGFEPRTKNKYRERQDHLVMQHFRDRIDKIFPSARPYECPLVNCDFSGKDRQALLRHYTGKHGVLELYLKEELASQGIDYHVASNGRRRHANSKLCRRARPVRKAIRRSMSSTDSGVSCTNSVGSQVDALLSSLPSGPLSRPFSLEPTFQPLSQVSPTVQTSTADELRREVSLIMASLKPIEKATLFKSQAVLANSVSETLRSLQPVTLSPSNHAVLSTRSDGVPFSTAPVVSMTDFPAPIYPAAPQRMGIQPTASQPGPGQVQPMSDILAHLPQDPIKLPPLDLGLSKSSGLVDSSPLLPGLDDASNLITVHAADDLMGSTGTTLTSTKTTVDDVQTTLLAFIEEDDATLRPTSLDSLLMTSPGGLQAPIVLQDATTQHFYVQTGPDANIQQTLNDALTLIGPDHVHHDSSQTYHMPAKANPFDSVTNDASSDSGISASGSSPAYPPGPASEAGIAPAVVVVNDLAQLDDGPFAINSGPGGMALYSSLESSVA